jgi:hypothetical protein
MIENLSDTELTIVIRAYYDYGKTEFVRLSKSEAQRKYERLKEEHNTLPPYGNWSGDLNNIINRGGGDKFSCRSS